MTALRILHKAPDFAIGAYDRLLVMRLTPPPSDDKIALFEAAIDEHLRNEPGGMLVWYNLAGFTAPPSSAVRERLRNIIARNKPNIFGTTLVLEAHGFVGATLRAAISTMTLLVKPTFPLRLCSTIDEGCSVAAALGQKAGRSVRADELRLIADELVAATGR